MRLLPHKGDRSLRTGVTFYDLVNNFLRDNAEKNVILASIRQSDPEMTANKERRSKWIMSVAKHIVGSVNVAIDQHLYAVPINREKKICDPNNAIKWVMATIQIEDDEPRVTKQKLNGKTVDGDTVKDVFETYFAGLSDEQYWELNDHNFPEDSEHKESVETDAPPATDELEDKVAEWKKKLGQG